MGDNLGFALDGAWKVLLAGLGPKPQPVGTGIGWLLFLLPLAGIALGITFIVASGFGKQLSFEHIFPTIVDKH